MTHAEDRGAHGPELGRVWHAQERQTVTRAAGVSLPSLGPATPPVNGQSVHFSSLDTCPQHEKAVGIILLNFPGSTRQGGAVPALFLEHSLTFGT